MVGEWELWSIFRKKSGRDDMAGIISYTRKVIVDSLKDRQALALAFILPSVVMLVIGYVIITMGSAQTINIGVVNTDQGMGNVSASTAIIRALQSQPNIVLVPMGADDLDGYMKNKTIDGALIFGDTFTSDLLTKKSTDVRLIIEGTDQSRAIAMTGLVNGVSTGVAGKMLKVAVTAPVSIISEKYYGNGLVATDFITPIFMGLIVFVLSCMFAIFTTQSRESQSLYEGVKMPGAAGKVIAYVSGFGLFGFIQALTVLLYVKYLINASIVGNIYAVMLMLLLLSAVGVAVGVLIASIARSDKQRIGLMAVMSILQVLFGGIILPIAKFPDYVQAFSYILPLTYAYNAIQNIVIRGFGLGDIWMDWTALIIIGLAAMALAALCFTRLPLVGVSGVKKERKAT